MKIAVSIIDQVEERTKQLQLAYPSLNYQVFSALPTDIPNVVSSAFMPVDYMITSMLEESLTVPFPEYQRPISDEAKESTLQTIRESHLHWINSVHMGEYLVLGDDMDRVVLAGSMLPSFTKRDERTDIEAGFLYVQEHNPMENVDSTIIDISGALCDVGTFAKLSSLWKHAGRLGIEEVVWNSWLRRQAILSKPREDELFGKYLWGFWFATVGIKVRKFG